MIAPEAILSVLDATLAIKEVDCVTLMITKVEINGYTLRDVNDVLDAV